MKSEIISQYKASLNMLFDVIEICPESLWDNKEYENSFWHITYHTLFFAALYLSKSPDNFIPWSKHIDTYNSLGKYTFDKKPVVISGVYSKDDIKEYWKIVTDRVEQSVNEMEDKPNSFHWIPGTEVQLHLYNIRHIQHHTGQLIERLHCSGIKGIKWVTAG